MYLAENGYLSTWLVKCTWPRDKLLGSGHTPGEDNLFVYTTRATCLAKFLVYVAGEASLVNIKNYKLFPLPKKYHSNTIEWSWGYNGQGYSNGI